MFTCKQISKALSEDDYKKLPFIKRFMLKIHVSLCVVCGKFNRQVMDSHDMCRHFKESEEALQASRPKLDEEKKKQFKKLLAEGNNTTQTE